MIDRFQSKRSAMRHFALQIGSEESEVSGWISRICGMKHRKDINMQIANGFSVDVEDYFHAEAITGQIGRHNWDTMQSRVVENTNRVLDLLSEHDVRATFFVLGWVAEHFPR